MSDTRVKEYDDAQVQGPEKKVSKGAEKEQAQGPPQLLCGGPPPHHLMVGGSPLPERTAIP